MYFFLPSSFALILFFCPPNLNPASKQLVEGRKIYKQKHMYIVNYQPAMRFIRASAAIWPLTHHHHCYLEIILIMHIQHDLLLTVSHCRRTFVQPWHEWWQLYNSCDHWDISSWHLLSTDYILIHISPVQPTCTKKHILSLWQNHCQRTSRLGQWSLYMRDSNRTNSMGK